MSDHQHLELLSQRAHANVHAAGWWCACPCAPSAGQVPALAALP
ncbi:hypothetical protein [Rhizobacter sp. LjRoot28]